MKATLKIAIKICRDLEEIAPMCGCHVALTGGTLYKHGDRKDVDIVFYRIRQAPVIDVGKLIIEMERIGFILDKYTGGWILKGTYAGINLDFFFPENEGDEKYSQDEIESKREAIEYKEIKKDCIPQ